MTSLGLSLMFLIRRKWRKKPHIVDEMYHIYVYEFDIFFYQAEDGIRDIGVTGVQTCALPISRCRAAGRGRPDAAAPAPASGSAGPGRRARSRAARRAGRRAAARAWRAAAWHG